VRLAALLHDIGKPATREWYYEVDLKRSYSHKFIEFKI
jgi:HD superfamily phosphodiesterase